MELVMRWIQTIALPPLIVMAGKDDRRLAIVTSHRPSIHHFISYVYERTLYNRETKYTIAHRLLGITTLNLRLNAW